MNVLRNAFFMIIYHDSHSHGVAEKSKIVCMSLAYAQQRTGDTPMLAFFLRP